MPLATVIIPYLDDRPSAARAIDDLCKQLSDDIHCILAKPNHVQGPQTEGPQFSIIEGQIDTNAQAVNLALASVETKYVGFYDPKDAWSAQKCLSHISAFEENNDLGLSFSGVHLNLPERLGMNWQHNPRLTNISAAYILKQNPIFAFSNVFARRAALEDSCLMNPETGAPQWCDPQAPDLISMDIALRMVTRTDWLVEGLPRALCQIRVCQEDLNPPSQQQIIAWKRLIKSRAPMAPAFFARHAGAARKEFLKGNTAYLQEISTPLQDTGAQEVDFLDRTFSRAIRSDFKNRAQVQIHMDEKEKGPEKTP